MAFACLAAPAAAREEEPPLVSRIRWEGVEALSTGELEDQILTTRRSWRPWGESRPFDEPTLREDVERIVAHYRDQGYYEAQAAYELDWNEAGTRVAVTFSLDEGEPVRLESFDVTWPDHPELDVAACEALTEGLALVPGEVFAVSAYREAREALLRRLADRGFPAATLSGGAEVVLEVHAASVAWSVDLGPKVRFGEVRVVGLQRVEEELVRRELTFAPGDVFSQRVLEESQQRILGLDLFRMVALRPVPPEPPQPPGSAEPPAPWPVEVRVEERPPRSVRVGVGYGTEDQLRVQLGWQHRNFFGKARSLSLDGKYSSLVLGAEATLLQPRWLEPELELELKAGARRETVPAYDADRFGFSETLRRPLWPNWQGRIGHAFEWNSGAELKTDDVGDLDPPESARLSYLMLGLRRSTVDDELDPTRGTWLDLSLEPSLEAIGSQLDYLRAVVEGRVYVPLPLPRTLVALRLRLGSLEPLGGAVDGDVPVVKRFFSGGSTTVRGFGYQKLGPLGDDGDPLGGLSLAEASSELRFPLWRRLGGVVFVDAGQVNLDPFRIDADDFFYSTGGGLRLATPIGPLRLDFGYVLNPPDGVDRFRVYFSVGQAF